MRHVRVALVALFSALIASCGGSPTLSEGSTAVTVAQALPAPDQTGMSLDLSNYRLGPQDEIKVEVFGAPEITRQGEVDAAGNFSLPLVGSMMAGGKTPGELSAMIAAQLKGRYLKNPQVSVNVVKAKGQTFTVDGAVKRPGVYPVVGRISLQQAVATAEGASEAANLGNVVVFRTVNNRKMAALFNMKDIRAGRLNDPDIYGNDIVVVGESAFRRFFTDLTAPLTAVGRFVPVL